MANETAPTWMRPYRNVASQTGSILGKYLADRGPHLAAMVAYYALLSLFPFIFLVLSAIGLLGHVSQSSYLIREMERILPSESVADLVKPDPLGAVERRQVLRDRPGRDAVERARLLLGAGVGPEHRVSGSATAGSWPASGSASCWC